MNAKEFAEKIGVNEKTVRNMIKRGDLKAIKVGKSYNIDEEQAKEMILSNRLDSQIGTTLGSLSASLSMLEKDKQDIFNNIFESFMEFDSKEDKAVTMAKFDKSNILEDLAKYEILNKEILNLKKTIKFISDKYKNERQLMLTQLLDELNNK